MGLTRRQIGVQAHCLRRQMADDFPGTLGKIKAMGFERIELCSFPGCAGNPWGDFGVLADWRPRDIRAALDSAELACPATHVASAELAAGAIDATIDWSNEVGCRVVVLSSLPTPADPSLPSWQEAFASLNSLGEIFAASGLQFAYHTQPEIWQTIDGRLLADELMERVDDSLCRIEIDPSGAIVSGAIWQDVVRCNPGRFLAMHLRDGKQPREPVQYLPALPLGAGDVDWDLAVQVAIDAGISDYFLEMEVDSGYDVFRALDDSLECLSALGLVKGDVH